MSLGSKSYPNKHNYMSSLVICLIFNLTFEEIKRTIDGVEKTPTEYKFHLDGDIFAVVIAFKTYRFVHIRYYRDETYPLDGVCYYSNYFEDLVKLLGKIRERNPSKWKYFGETIKKWSYHRKEGQANLGHIEKCSIGDFTQTVSLQKLLVNNFL